MVRDYIPQRGDIVSLQFDPHAGREQAGRRPALVLSPTIYNGKVGLMLACPITSKKKGYPFEVVLPDSLTTHGVILADNIKSLDWRIRNASFVEKVDKSVLDELLKKLLLLLDS